MEITDKQVKDALETLYAYVAQEKEKGGKDNTHLFISMITGHRDALLIEGKRRNLMAGLAFWASQNKELSEIFRTAAGVSDILTAARTKKTPQS